jgi:release factor glutamine methyltransferase
MADFHPLPSLSDTASPQIDALNKEAEKRAKECTPAVMPSLDHLSMKDYDQVYEPSDDTYLLLDGILLAITSGLVDTKTAESMNTLEIGCGTGVPIVYMAKQLQKSKLENVAHVTDINPEALRVAQATATENDIAALQVSECDLAYSLLPNMEHSIDVLLFNPPYVPTPDDEVGSKGIEASWAGGVNGRRVVDRAVSQMAQLLRPTTGQAFMITVDDNKPEELAANFLQLGLLMEPYVRRRARNEYLTVQRISWIQ